MSNRIIEFAKEHPYKSAGVVVLVVIAYIYLKRAGGSTSDGSVDSSQYMDAQSAEVAYGTQLQQSQLGYQAAALQSNNQAAVANNQISAQEISDQLSSTDTLAGISAQRDVQLNSDTLAAQTTQAVSLLQAQVAEGQTTAGVQTAQIQADAYTSIANAPYAEAAHEADLQYAYAMASIPSNAQLQAIQSSLADIYSNLGSLGTTVGTLSTNNSTLTQSFLNYSAQVNTSLGEIAQNLPSGNGNVAVVLPYGSNTFGAHDTTNTTNYNVIH